MSRVNRSNLPPQFAQQGIVMREAVSASLQEVPPPAPSTSSPLLSILPTYDSWNFGAREIVIDSAAGTSPALAAGQSAFFGLGRIQVDTDTGCEVGFVGYDLQLLPTDVNGTATPSAGTVAAWGNTTGTGAAVVIGIGLPIVPSAWNGAIAYIPGIDNANTSNLRLPDNAPRYLCVQGYPTGAISDTTPNKLNVRYMSGASLVRVTRGQTLDIAIVLNSTQYTAIRALGARVLVGHTSVILKTTPFRNSYAWGG